MLKREGQTAEGEVEHGGGTDCWMGRLQEWMNTYSTEQKNGAGGVPENRVKQKTLLWIFAK